MHQGILHEFRGQDAGRIQPSGMSRNAPKGLEDVLMTVRHTPGFAPAREA